MSAKLVLLIHEERDRELEKVLSVVLNFIAGWDVASFGVKENGVNPVLKRSPDLIIFNIRLLNLKGLSLTQKHVIQSLKALPLTEAAPVLLLTDQAGWLSTEQLRQLGILGAIAKPFVPETLPTEISRLLRWS